MRALRLLARCVVSSRRGNTERTVADGGAAPQQQLFDMGTQESLIIYSDGGSRGNPGPSAIGAVVLDSSTDPPTTLASVSESIGFATNNIAEYRALIAGLEAASRFAARHVEVRADSQLVIRQLQGVYKVRDANLRPLCQQALSMLRSYESVKLTHVRREENTVADALVNHALDAE